MGRKRGCFPILGFPAERNWSFGKAQRRSRKENCTSEDQNLEGMMGMCRLAQSRSQSGNPG
jgi:hypothetical protein